MAGKYASLWVYLAGPMLGGLIGWGLYRFFTPPDDELVLRDRDLQVVTRDGDRIDRVDRDADPRRRVGSRVGGDRSDK